MKVLWRNLIGAIKYCIKYPQFFIPDFFMRGIWINGTTLYLYPWRREDKEYKYYDVDVASVFRTREEQDEFWNEYNLSHVHIRYTKFRKFIDECFSLNNNPSPYDTYVIKKKDMCELLHLLNDCFSFFENFSTEVDWENEVFPEKFTDADRIKTIKSYKLVADNLINKITDALNGDKTDGK